MATTLHNGHETVEVVDGCNRLLALMPRDQVHKQELLHRAVLVLVFDGLNRLVLQRRHPKKELYPGRWDISVTGHVLPGEAKLEAALRELREELGVRLSRLKMRCEIPGTADTGYEFVTLFTAGRVTAALRPDPDEVIDLYACDREELDLMVNEVPEMLTPALRYFWDRDLLFPPLLSG